MWEQSFLGLFADPGDYSRVRSSVDGAEVADMDRPLAEGSEQADVEEHLWRPTVCDVAVLLPFCLLVVAYNLLGAALWVWSVFILAQDQERPCDQPLKGWLFVTVVWVAVDKVVYPYRCSQSFSVAHNIDRNVLPTLCSVLARSLVLASGLWLYTCSKTCAMLSPSIYACVRCYLVFHTVFVINKAAVGYALVHLILRLARAGRFPFAQPHAGRAARAGLVDELATVERAGDLLVEGGNNGAGANRVAPECSVCLCGLDGGGDVKCTPCSPVPHYFHRECLRTWLERYGKTCPVCRTDLEKAVHGVPPGADLEKAAARDSTHPGGDLAWWTTTARTAA